MGTCGSRPSTLAPSPPVKASWLETEPLVPLPVTEAVLTSRVEGGVGGLWPGVGEGGLGEVVGEGVGDGELGEVEGVGVGDGGLGLRPGDWPPSGGLSGGDWLGAGPGDWPAEGLGAELGGEETSTGGDRPVVGTCKWQAGRWGGRA